MVKPGDSLSRLPAIREYRFANASQQNEQFIHYPTRSIIGDTRAEWWINIDLTSLSLYPAEPFHIR